MEGIVTDALKPETVTLVLIDDSRDFCEAVATSIGLHYSEEIKVIGIAHNGEDGIKLINEIHPEVAVIDVCMPITDGPSVIENVKRNEKTRHTSCIALSGVMTDFSVCRASEAGADYICSKPMDVHGLAKCIIKITEYKKRNIKRKNWIMGPEEFAETALLDMGFSSKTKGFFFLKSAIFCCIKNVSWLDMLTKELYPQVGKLYGSNGDRAERAMRHSILIAWRNGRPNNYQHYAANDDDRRPTVGAFLRIMVDAYMSRNKN